MAGAGSNSIRRKCVKAGKRLEQHVQQVYFCLLHMKNEGVVVGD